MKLASLFTLSLVLLSVPAWAQPPANPDNGKRAKGGDVTPLPFLINKLDAGLDALVAADAKLETIATVPGINGEGPMWREGRLWVSDQRGGNMYAVAPDGKVSTLAEKVAPINPEFNYSQGPNALVTDKDGSVLVARQGLRDIGRMKADGTFTEVLSSFEGKRLNCPNDMVISPDGALWFTDPAFSVPGGRTGNATPDSQMPIEGVYRYKDGKLTRVVSDTKLPNGIGVSPDGKTLYVGPTGAPALRAYTIEADGTLSNRRDFSYGVTPEMGLRGYVDGMKVDAKGNVWTTSQGGITVFSPEGKVLGRIQLPGQASNLAFGGADYKDVFFTSGANIYRLHTLVGGLKPMYARP